jgi:hypothetical protein
MSNPSCHLHNWCARAKVNCRRWNTLQQPSCLHSSPCGRLLSHRKALSTRSWIYISIGGFTRKSIYEVTIRVVSDRSCHRDQAVTLTTVQPHLPVRIVGITNDHGLLRTLPEQGGWSHSRPNYVDLQPDGNSFDLMSGLIKTKA